MNVISARPGSDAILARLLALHPKKIDLQLDRILRLLHLGDASDIFGHEPVLQHLLSLIRRHIANVVGLGAFPCKVSDLATTSASEQLGKPSFRQVHLHGCGSR